MPSRIRTNNRITEMKRLKLGHYLHPEAFDQPEELSIEWARNPEMMKQRKEAREQTGKKKAQGNER